MKKIIYYILILVFGGACFYLYTNTTNTKATIPAVPVNQDINQPVELTPIIATSTSATSTQTTTVSQYTVKPGDTIGAIAQQLNIPQSRILLANNLTETSILKLDQSLKIPADTDVLPNKPEITQPTIEKIITKKPTATKKTTKLKTSGSVTWSSSGLSELRKIPSAIRPSVKAKITSYAKSHGIKIITREVYKRIRI